MPMLFFDLAKRIAPLSAKLLFHQAVFWFDYSLQHGKIKYLEIAEKHISQAINVESSFFEAWYIWGDILTHIGLAKHDPKYFFEADKKYGKAYRLCGDDPYALSKFQWDWALTWYFLGKHSGEAVDIKVSLEKFDKAARVGCQEPSFWRDYGNAWVEMGILIQDSRFLQRALIFYNKSVHQDSSYFDGWFVLAQTFHHIYKATNEESHLAQSHEAYAKAVECKHSSHCLTWQNWGQLFLLSGKPEK